MMHSRQMTTIAAILSIFAAVFTAIPPPYFFARVRRMDMSTGTSMMKNIISATAVE